MLCRAFFLVLFCAGVFCASAFAQKPELVVQTGHLEVIERLAFSPNGELLISSASLSPILKLWHVQTGKLVADIQVSEKDMRYLFWNRLTQRPILVSNLTTDIDSTLLIFPNSTEQPANIANSKKFIAKLDNKSDSSLRGNDSTIIVWDKQEKRIKAKLQGHQMALTEQTKSKYFSFHAAFSSDEKQLISIGNDGYLIIWDIESGKVDKRIQLTQNPKRNFLECVVFSPNNKLIACGSRANLFILDAQTGKILHSINNAFDMANARAVKFSNDGASAAFVTSNGYTGKNTSLFTFDFISGLTKCFDTKPFLPKSLRSYSELIKDSLGLIKFTAMTDSVCYVLSSTNGSISSQFFLNKLTKGTFWLANRVDYFSDKIVVPVYNKPANSQGYSSIRAYDLTNAKPLWEYSYDSSSIKTIRFADGGKLVVSQNSLNNKNLTYIFNSQTGKKIAELTGYAKLRLDNTIQIGKAFFTDTIEQKKIIRLPNIFDTTSQTIIPSNGELIDQDESIAIVRISPNDTVKIHISSGLGFSKKIPTESVNMFTKPVDASKRFVVVGSEITPKFTIYERESGKELASLFLLDSTNWAVTAPDGRFDGSEGGLRYLHFVVGNEPIELEQLKERYYEPGLLSKIMGYNKESLREIERFESVKLYPRIEVQQGDNSAKASTKSEAKPDTKPEAKPRSKTNAKSTARSITPNTPNVASNNLTFTVKLTNQGGGFGRVPVWLNGKELTDDARPQNARTDAAEMAITLNLEGNRLLLPGTTNTLEVRAFNAENAVLSRSAKHDFQAPGERLQSAPHLYAIVGGTSDYQGEELDLPFAAADAEQIAKAVRIAGERLLGADRVHITLLASKRDSSQSKSRTTKANIVAALKDVQTKATANDILFVYLTGHGINWGGQDGDWYYLTTDARLGDDEKFTDAALRTSVALSSRELTDLMKAIPARKQTLALDACASGKAVENLLVSRDVPSSQLRAMMRMKDRAGLHVISGCASNAVSYEASRYGQGLLTYSLLMGMKGGALRDNQFVDVKQLFEFAADRVPELARDIGRVQKPQVCSPFGGGSFDIGLVTEAEAKSIPLADAKPLFVRANFQDEKKMYDQLNLGKIVNESLRGVTYRAATNPFEAWLVYLDVPEFPNSYALNGRYTIKGDEITVSAVLRRGEEEGTVFTVKGAAANVKELAQTLVTETQKRMK